MNTHSRRYITQTLIHITSNRASCLWSPRVCVAFRTLVVLLLAAFSVLYNLPLRTKATTRCRIYDSLLVICTGGPDVHSLAAAFCKYHDQAQPLFRSNRPNSSSTPTGLAAEHPEANKELLELVQRMLDLDPDSRPTVKQLLQDPVFAGLGSSIPAIQRQLTSDAFSKSLEAINSRKV